ncbi:MAG: transglycosylase SLT domain-containing protein [Acidobacteria bacterium]|nr:transglycosylase SLT domain-containing protein [Acidobacteriota bacterium]
MKRSFARSLLILLCVNLTFSQNIAEAEKKISQAVESRSYDTALTELLNLRTSDVAAFNTKDHDYLLARMAESTGDLALAMSTYRTVADRNSPLKPYALKHLAQIARSTGNLLLERIYLNEIQMFTPESLAAKAAVYRLARNSFEVGNYGETIRILSSSPRDTTKAVDIATDRETKGLLAEAYFRNGQTQQAHDAFAALLDSVPNAAQPDDIALIAVRDLDAIDGGEKGKKAPALAEAEHFRRANVYQFNREFADARLHYEALIANFGTGTNAANAVFQIGRGFAQQANFVEALKWYERVIEQYPQSTAAKDALLQAASAYGRVVRPKEATKRYQLFIDKYPDDERLDRAYLNIVDILRDQGEDTDAIRACEKIRDVFKGKPPEAIALFTEARIYFAREEWQNAVDTLEKLKSFNDLGGATVPGGTSVSEVTFLNGFALEKLNKFPEAIETYLSINDGRGEYYGWRATERLKAMAANETAKPFFSQAIGRASAALASGDAEAKRKNAIAILRLSDNADIRERAVSVLRSTEPPLPKGLDRTEPKAVKGRSLADKFIALGLYDEAVFEIEAAATDRAKLPLEKLLADLVAFERGDRADRVMEFVEPIWRSVPADFPIELMPRRQIEMLYPVPFKEELLKFAPERGVDPRLLLAIMRQESRFRPDAKSNAAARGLMQFISTTSNRVAAELNRGNFQQDELYSPPTAILFGSQYLSTLFRTFPGQADAVVASCNGGEDNMTRWLNRSRSNIPERYVPEVVYSQSKDYVQRVMASYRMYRFLYDEQLRPTGR